MNTRRIYQFLAGCVIILHSATAFPQDAADADYAAELKRVPPTEPADALKTFEVIPGYKLELVAAEPLVTSPVAASFDEDGRLYVVEMRDYSEQDKEKLGRIRLLTDTDGNGVFDKSEIFAEALSWPTAVIAYGGCIFVGAAPDIWYLKDTDRDGRADEQNRVFTGFGRGNVQGLLNSFTWGLDNRIHVAVSTAGAELQRVDSADKPTGKPLALRGRDFSFDPRHPDDFIATSGGGQHGMSFDDWGRKFVSSNSDHIQLIMLEDADLARNPYLVAPNPRISIALDGPQADVFRISPVEPWREVRTRLRVKGIVPGIVEGGGRAAGYFTGATGITIYRGNAWPKEDRGLAIIGDVGSNLIHRKRLIPHGLELRAKRIDEKREFVASRDNWFRPVQFLNAPDGALYVLDMYRETIEHPASLPPVIKKHLDLTSGRDRGRIYRIVPANFQQPLLPKLSTATTAELVAVLEHENGWHRDTAARLLYERQDIAAVRALDNLVRKSTLPLSRMHALHVLQGMQVLTSAVATDALHDIDPRVVAHAVPLAVTHANTSMKVRDRLLSIGQLDDPRLRFEVLSAIGSLSDVDRQAAVARILSKDAKDPWMRVAAQSSLRGGAASVIVALVNDPGFVGDADRRKIAEQLFIAESLNPQTREFTAIAAALKSTETSELFAEAVRKLPVEASLRVRKYFSVLDIDRNLLDQLQIEAVRIIRSEDSEPAERAQAVGWLCWYRKQLPLDLLWEQLDPAQPAEVQTAVIQLILSQEDRDGETYANEIVRRWKGFSPQVRERAVSAFLANRSLKPVLVNAIEHGKITEADLSTSQRNELSGKVDIAPTTDQIARAKVVAVYSESLKLPGDKTRGAEHFKKQCSACHKLGDVGKEIGPNLAAMKNRGAEAILVNVLDPNREVNPQFVTYTVVTKDGRTLSGMIAAETATSITLRRGEGQEDTVLRIDIEVLCSTGMSLMPEGLEKQLDQQQLADVIAFILAQ